MATKANYPSSQQGGKNNQRKPPPTPQAQRTRAEGYNLADLSGVSFAPLRYYVENMLVEGLTLLGGRPKKGKSWMALGMGIDIASGEDTLGGLPTRQSNVIYYALEDNPRRIKRRAKTLLDEDDWPANLHIYHELSATDAGGLDEIREDVEKHKAKVIFIDTLAPIRPRPPKGIDPYQHDYNVISSIQKLAHELRVVIVLVYHTRKAMADDPQELIMGTTGITGAVDSWFVLKVTAESSELHGGGRDIENVEWALQHGTNARWTIIGEAWEARRSQQRRDILNVLRTSKGEVKTAKIAEEVKRDVGAVRKLLHSMERKGEIARVRHGHYSIKQQR